MEAEVYILGFGLVVFGIIQLITGVFTMKKRTNNGLVIIINDLFKMPKTMVQLAFVQFFSWFALFSMWIYTTAGVTSTKYDMKLDRDIFTSINKLLTEFQYYRKRKTGLIWKTSGLILQFLKKNLMLTEGLSQP